MKNILLLLVGGLLFVLCYRVSRLQTAYVNANQANADYVQKPTTEPAIIQSSPSLVMSVANY